LICSQNLLQGKIENSHIVNVNMEEEAGSIPH
jgi:hypothetical protein